MANKTYVRLKILSKARTPEEISRELGVACDASWRIGDLHAKTIVVEKQHGWILNSSLPITADLQDHVQELLAKLAPIANKVKALTSSDVVEFSCVVYATKMPALYFETITLGSLTRLGAALDIDLYIGRPFGGTKKVVSRSNRGVRKRRRPRK